MGLLAFSLLPGAIAAIVVSFTPRRAELTASFLSEQPMVCGSRLHRPRGDYVAHRRNQMISDYSRRWVLARMFSEFSCKSGIGFVSLASFLLDPFHACATPCGFRRGRSGEAHPKLITIGEFDASRPVLSLLTFP